jgi:hypothetical protein
MADRSHGQNLSLLLLPLVNYLHDRYPAWLTADGVQLDHAGLAGLKP